jgi:hypothetical protein
MKWRNLGISSDRAKVGVSHQHQDLGTRRLGRTPDAHVERTRSVELAPGGRAGSPGTRDRMLEAWPGRLGIGIGGRRERRA